MRRPASWLDELGRELEGRGIGGAWRRRIVLELADHLACDPAAALGAPGEVAERFAVELRVARSRRSTFAGVAALVLTAILFASSALALDPRGWPNATGIRGWIIASAGVAIVLGGQTAFVAGVLALRRTLHGRRGPGDLLLAHRRMRAALVAGGVAATGQLVQALALRPLEPGWWLAVSLPAGLVPLVVLGAAGIAGRKAAVLVPEPDETPAGIVADLPAWLGSRARVVLGGAGVIAVACVVAQGAMFEHSIGEGLVRGASETVAIVVGLALLGRHLGLRREARHTALDES